MKAHSHHTLPIEAQVSLQSIQVVNELETLGCR